MRPVLCLLCLPFIPLTVAAQTPPAANADYSINISPGTEREAFQHIPWKEIPADLRDKIRSGRSLTRQTWVISPSLEPRVAGLGPTYNRPSCLSCHPANGRGEAPASVSEPMRGMLVRLSIPGKDAHGGPNPEPRYGDQLNELGIPGVPGEGEAFLEWQTRTERLADGQQVELRWPKIAFRHLGYGPLHTQVMTSVRIAPPIFGLGLLEAVPEADILAIAKAQKAEGKGVAGQPNRVWDAGLKREVLGRFGWKANQPSTRQQIAGALAGDMGVTSDIMPAPNCPPAQKACAEKSKANEKHPEISTADLDDMALYHFALAVPAPRQQNNAKVLAGKALFQSAGCASCHRPELKTAAFPALPTLANRTLRPYTDLLLHDMGAGLAD
ncbi:MAG: c-type cytochrome, partial [Azoarcus sp.]|nr:c-type cytochrome [Azoarcus sp.]